MAVPLTALAAVTISPAVKIDGVGSFAGISAFNVNNGIALAGNVGVVTAANAAMLDGD